MLENIILISVIIIIIGGASLYIYREKKKGVACVGCPHAKECMKRKNGCGCGNSCNSGEDK